MGSINCSSSINKPKFQAGDFVILTPSLPYHHQIHRCGVYRIDSVHEEGYITRSSRLQVEGGRLISIQSHGNIDAYGNKLQKIKNVQELEHYRCLIEDMHREKEEKQQEQERKRIEYEKEQERNRIEYKQELDEWVETLDKLALLQKRSLQITTMQQIIDSGLYFEPGEFVTLKQINSKIIHKERNGCIKFNENCFRIAGNDKMHITRLIDRLKNYDERKEFNVHLPLKQIAFKECEDENNIFVFGFEELKKRRIDPDVVSDEYRKFKTLELLIAHVQHSFQFIPLTTPYLEFNRCLPRKEYMTKMNESIAPQKRSTLIKINESQKVLIQKYLAEYRGIRKEINEKTRRHREEQQEKQQQEYQQEYHRKKELFLKISTNSKYSDERISAFNSLSPYKQQQAVMEFFSEFKRLEAAHLEKKREFNFGHRNDSYLREFPNYSDEYKFKLLLKWQKEEEEKRCDLHRRERNRLNGGNKQNHHQNYNYSTQKPTYTNDYGLKYWEEKTARRDQKAQENYDRLVHDSFVNVCNLHEKTKSGHY